MQSGCNSGRIDLIFWSLLAVLISLSVLGLFAGAGLVVLGRLRQGATSALEGLALGMLPALVLLRLLPHAYESLGVGALLLAALGFGVVSLSHYAGERAEARLGSALVLPALLLHAVTDGAALAISNTGRVGDSAGLLAVAAILHRIPEGFYIASRQKVHSARAALLAAAPLALATIAGATLGGRIFAVLPDSALDGVLALGAGAMLRLFVHTHDEQPAPQPPAARAIAAAALLCGVIVVVAVPGPDDVLQSAQPREFSVARSLLPLFIESSPALLIGLLLASVLRLLSQRWPAPAPAGSVQGSLVGWLWGMARQLRASELSSLVEGGRARRSASVALLTGACVATAQLGAETITLSLAWLGARVTLVRVLGSALFALVVGLLCARSSLSRARADAASRVREGVRSDRHTHAHATQPSAPARSPKPERPEPGARSWRSWWALLQQALDDNAGWLVLGLLLSAALEAALTAELLPQLPRPWDAVFACAVALLARVSALGMTPVVAVLLHKGLHLGAALSLLWLSPLASFPLAFWVGARPSLRSVLMGGGALVALSLALGQAVERLLTKHGVPELHPLVTHDCSVWEYACGALLAALLVRSLLRLGPRGFAGSKAPSVPDSALCAAQH